MGYSAIARAPHLTAQPNPQWSKICVLLQARSLGRKALIHEPQWWRWVAQGSLARGSDAGAVELHPVCNPESGRAALRCSTFLKIHTPCPAGARVFNPCWRDCLQVGIYCTLAIRARPSDTAWLCVSVLIRTAAGGLK